MRDVACGFPARAADAAAVGSKRCVERVGPPKPALLTGRLLNAMDLNLRNACVIGGSGFVGRRICSLLSASGVNVRVPTRYRQRAKEELIVLPTTEVIEADVHDPGTLRQLISEMDAVINLVGVLHDRGAPGGFQRAHAELSKKIVDACKAAGVGRYLHMSALNADVTGPSAYLRSKGQGEQHVKQADDALAWTIFRPSVIFGRDDSFLNLFAKLVKVLPVVALGSPDATFQPVFVEDVARAFVNSITNDETFGTSYDLCGPRVYTLRQLVEYVRELTGRHPPIIGLGDRLSYLQAAFMEWLPGPLMTRDNYESMKVDSVCHCDFPAAFRFRPTALEAVVPQYLARQDPRGRYQYFRARASR